MYPIFVEREHAEFIQMKDHIKVIEAELEQVKMREQKALSRLSEVRATYAHEHAQISKRLNEARTENEKLRKIKTRKEQEKYDKDLYTNKYGYFDVANKTQREVERAKEAQRRAEDRV